MDTNMEELRKAAERLSRWTECCLRNAFDEHEYSTNSALQDCDEVALEKWAIYELARRDAEQAERERPIDEEWLRSKWPVVRNDATGFGVNVGIGNVILDRLPNSSGNACVNLSKKNVVLDRCCVVLVTRGQLLDLLNALKGGAT